MTISFKSSKFVRKYTNQFQIPTVGEKAYNQKKAHFVTRTSKLEVPRMSEISSKSNFAGAVTRLVTNHLIALQNYSQQTGVQGALKVPIGKTAVGSMNRK